jgi:hypothetical protein
VAGEAGPSYEHDEERSKEPLLVELRSEMARSWGGIHAPPQVIITLEIQYRHLFTV